MSASGNKPPASAPPDALPEAASDAAEIDAFLTQMNALPASGSRGPRGRLIFAMDATMSRQPTWEMAQTLQAGMFAEVARIGGLDVQLVFFRGHDECRASRWVSDAAALTGLMRRVQCEGGYTQLRKVLLHARRETGTRPVNALVYVGDCMEEAVDELAALAGELGLLGVPAFLFQEGRDSMAEAAFREIARLTKGAYCRFDAGSGVQLRALLGAVAAYAAGGQAALEDYGRTTAGARLLLEQLRR